MVEPNEEKLSDREQEILRLVATGASNKEIAAQLTISPNTVKVHLRNIFSKIGVASRTEATLYAIQQGYVTMPTGAAAELPLVQDGVRAPEPTSRSARRWLYLSGALALILGLTMLGLTAARRWAPPTTPTAATRPLSPAVGRWETRAPLPTPRRALAAAVYEGQIYAMGGATAEGVTGVVERFDPDTNTWQALAPMPQPVAEISAVVIGGLIYVPGGRTADGTPTDRLAVYDPRRDAWETRASLPRAISAYALAAFEGKLYLFGGWDGQHYLNDVYAYIPDLDRWEPRTAMPTARSLAGAAVAGGRIYVAGGTEGGDALTTLEVFLPDADQRGETAWLPGPALPAGRSGAGVIGISDVVRVIGGAGAAEPQQLFLDRQGGAWQIVESPDLPAVSQPALVLNGAFLHLLGGQVGESPSAQHRAYQVIYLIPLPFLSP